jgi:hypothetical protein
VVAAGWVDSVAVVVGVTTTTLVSVDACPLINVVLLDVEKDVLGGALVVRDVVVSGSFVVGSFVEVGVGSFVVVGSSVGDGSALELVGSFVDDGSGTGTALELVLGLAVVVEVVGSGVVGSGAGLLVVGDVSCEGVGVGVGVGVGSGVGVGVSSLEEVVGVVVGDARGVVVVLEGGLEEVSGVEVLLF